MQRLAHIVAVQEASAPVLLARHKGLLLASQGLVPAACSQGLEHGVALHAASLRLLAHGPVEPVHVQVARRRLHLCLQQKALGHLLLGGVAAPVLALGGPQRTDPRLHLALPVPLVHHGLGHQLLPPEGGHHANHVLVRIVEGVPHEEALQLQPLLGVQLGLLVHHQLGEHWHVVSAVAFGRQVERVRLELGELFEKLDDDFVVVLRGEVVSDVVVEALVLAV
mmetsp:Transcript_47648/g.90934  ORF Transcript_47648/g.90934 Transcript_47648/m.90934 type:complete len:223 (-) Transcript_47648:548-1216(-)